MKLTTFDNLYILPGAIQQKIRLIKALWNIRSNITHELMLSAYMWIDAISQRIPNAPIVREYLQE